MIEFSVLYGMASGTVGTAVAVVALYRTLAAERVCLEVEVGQGESYGHPCFYITMYYKGRVVKIHSVGAVMYGDNTAVDFNEPYARSPKAPEKPPCFRVDYPILLPSNDLFEFPPQFFRTDLMHKNQKKWAVRIVFDAGEAVEIPNWRLEYGGITKITSPMFRPKSKPRLRIGHRYFKAYTERTRYDNSLSKD